MARVISTSKYTETEVITLTLFRRAHHYAHHYPPPHMGTRARNNFAEFFLSTFVFVSTVFLLKHAKPQIILAIIGTRHWSEKMEIVTSVERRGVISQGSLNLRARIIQIKLNSALAQARTLMVGWR